ncbi:MAG: hypothetical protein KAJ19_06265 [Gammaproteobacteria bacterium]|nr:hypothetical protein [Gammaproteobacteria bacterium]
MIAINDCVGGIKYEKNAQSSEVIEKLDGHLKDELKRGAIKYKIRGVKKWIRKKERFG